MKKAYMCHVIVEFQIMVDDGVVHVVQPEEMFQSPGALVVLYLDVVDFDGVDGYGGGVAAAEETGESKGIGEG